MTDLTDTPDWVRDAVFYQIFPDRFASSPRVQKPGQLEPWDARPTFHGFKGGDLLGVVQHLDYLGDLGVNALYLTPIFSSASNHRYHTYDYYAVDPLLGGDAALRELLDACHGRGMRVVLDGVFNHSGRGFWPFHHVAENGIGSPYVDWFYVDRAALAAGKQLRPYPSEDDRRRFEAAARAEPSRRDELSLQYLGYRAWWGLPALPKLNTNNPQMREHLMGAAEHWLRFGIDGWRLDVAEEIDADYWRDFRRRVRAVRDDAYIVAEIWREKPQWLTGDTFDALMNYPLTEALLSFTAARYLDSAVVSSQHEYSEFVRPIDGPAFAARLAHLMTMYRPEAIGVQLNLLGSHDTARYLTVAGGNVDSFRLALLTVMTLPGAPCVYYGDEVGVEGRHDPDNRQGFPWDESKWNKPLLDWVKALTALRTHEPLMRRGTFRSLAASGDAVAYGRFASDGAAAVIAINTGEAATRVSFSAPELAGTHLEPVELPGAAAGLAVGQPPADGSAWVDVPRRSGAVLLARKGSEA